MPHTAALIVESYKEPVLVGGLITEHGNMLALETPAMKLGIEIPKQYVACPRCESGEFILADRFQPNPQCPDCHGDGLVEDHARANCSALKVSTGRDGSGAGLQVTQCSEQKIDSARSPSEHS